MAVATISLPVPLSPVIKTVEVLPAIRAMSSFIRMVAGLLPTMLSTFTVRTVAVIS